MPLCWPEPLASKTTGQEVLPWTVNRPSMYKRAPAANSTVLHPWMMSSSETGTV